MPRKKKPPKPLLYTTVRTAPMGDYIFRMPAGTPALTSAGLDQFVGFTGERKIGTTVTVIRTAEHVYLFRLYHTLLATIEPDRVTFSQHGDRHQATREWLAKIVSDNDLGYTVYRPRSGKLCINGEEERPVEGRAYRLSGPNYQFPIGHPVHTPTVEMPAVPEPHPTPSA